MDLEVVIVSAPSGYDTTIGIMTGLQTDSDQGWLHGSSATLSFDFPPITGAGSAFKRFDAGMLRYIRWVVAGSTAPSANTVSFYIRGVARSYR